jgi:hypothetical protein
MAYMAQGTYGSQMKEILADKELTKIFMEYATLSREEQDYFAFVRMKDGSLKIFDNRPDKIKTENRNTVGI